MLYTKKKTLTASKYTCYAVVFFIGLFINFSCKQAVQHPNQGYFSSVLKKIDSSASTNGGYYNGADIAQLDRAFTVAIAAGPGEDPADVYYGKMNYYWYVKHVYDSAILYAEKYIDLLQYHADDKEFLHRCTKSTLLKGDIYFSREKYEDAIDNYTAAKLLMSGRPPDTILLNRYYYSMTSFLYHQHKYPQAIKFCLLINSQAAVCYKNPYQAFNVVQSNLDNIGICYDHAGIYDSALYYYNMALDYINQNQKKFPEKPASDFSIGRALIYGNMGEILRRQKNMAEAEALLLKSYEDSKNAPDTSYTQSAQFALVDLYLEAGKVKKAGEILCHLIRPVDSAEIGGGTISYYRTLSNYYLKTNQVVAANKLLLRSYNMKDSLEKRDKLFISTDINKEFENSEQKRINQSLTKDNATKNRYLLAAVTGTCFSLYNHNAGMAQLKAQVSLCK